MPARQFFVMVKAARRVRSWEFSQLCDVASIPLGDSKYFDVVKKSFSITPPEKFLEPAFSSGPTIKAESTDAMLVFMSAINARKGRGH